MKTSEWTAALRSGEYEQSQNALCDGSGFCCLGVLAEASGVYRQPDENNPEVINYHFPMPSGDVRIEDAVIPLFLRDKMIEDLDLDLKLRLESAVIDGHTYGPAPLHDRLMTMNDEGRTFSQIADYIEKVQADGQR